MNKPVAKKVIYIKGLPLDKVSKVSKMDPYYRNIKLQLPGNNNLDNFGKLPGYKVINMCFNGEPCRMGIPDILVNCMADPDSLEQRLKYLDSVIPRLKKQNPDLKVINQPNGVLKTRRDDIAGMFQGLKDIIVPKVVKLFPTSRRDFVEKIRSSGIKLPVLIREAGVHSGINLTLLETFGEDQLEQLDKFALDGRGHYATEFHDFKSRDGYYRKVRIIMINGEPHLRHMIIGDHWNIHNNSREEFMSKHPALAAEEEKFLRNGKNNFSEDVLASMQKIYKKLGLDIFGLDVGILPGGKLLVFEINAAMEFLALHIKHAPYIMEQINKIRGNFIKLVTNGT